MTENHSPTELESEMRPELDEALLGLDELAQENAAEALLMFQSLPEPVQILPDFQLVLARAHQALDHLKVARDIAEKLIRSNDKRADAHHLLGDLLEDLGEPEDANTHFLRTLELDKEAFQRQHELPPSSLMARLQEISQKTYDELRQNDLKLTLNRAADIQLFPSNEAVEGGTDPRALLSWQTEQPEADSADEKTSGLTIYAANIDAEYGDLEEFDQFDSLVTQELRAELAEHLGLSNAAIKALGWPAPGD